MYCKIVFYLAYWVSQTILIIVSAQIHTVLSVTIVIIVDLNVLYTPKVVLFEIAPLYNTFNIYIHECVL